MTAALELLLFAAALSGTVFFSACETALTSVSLSAWDRLRQTTASAGDAYRLWSGDPHLMLAILLFGNTLCTLGAGIIASALFRPIGIWFHWRSSLTVIVCSFITGSFLLVFGEILPKLYARRYQERVLIKTAKPLVVVTALLGPWMRGLSDISHALKRMISRRPAEPVVTTDELRQVVTETQPEALAPSERRMLSNLIVFDQVKVQEVMVPRAEIVAIRLEQDHERMFTAIIRSGFSRLPVFFGNLDNIVGIVYAKDLLVEWRTQGLLVLEDLLRPIYRIAPDAPLAALLQAFRQGQHMAIVTDAAGVTRGVVTIEDVVEAIVGEIADEFDQPH